VKKAFVKGIELKDTNARSNVLPKHFSQTTKVNGFSLPKEQDPSKTFPFSHHFLRPFLSKKIKYG